MSKNGVSVDDDSILNIIYMCPYCLGYDGYFILPQIYYSKLKNSPL